MTYQGASETYLVRQKKEWGEILTGFETRNRYAVTDEAGRELYLAAEVGGSTLGRMFLKHLRPWTIHILDPAGRAVVTFERPWRWFFHEAAVRDAAGNHLGTIKRQWSWIRRRYAILDASGAEALELFGPLLRPWTFIVRRDGEEIGAIRKKWSGLLKEAFTVADNFGVTFPADLDTPLKSLLLGAVFLIDFVHFEDRDN